ncbi:MAG TPA: gluconate 2-dehydrogenase subunit 3 family protein [Bryobacteraceae bacterium]|nr:gluconate 2-dehydrogenase subunit 3 family protein [Bryobacteraceae bacterium]
MRRRTFLEAGASVAVAGSLAGCAARGAAGQWRFFTASEARAVDAVCENLIPADRDPGAKSAGVVQYIDIQLAKAFRKHRQAYRLGIAHIDSMSRERFGAGFADLAAAQQTDILRTLEQNSRPFFQLILSHTWQGFYGDPRHGGNRNRASWKMVGLDYPPLRGRQHYEGA